MPRDDYQERQDARRERLESRAEKLTRESESLHKSAHDMASIIPFGQPILVGHHSEKRDRNYRGRIHNKFARSFEAQKKAGECAAKADSVGKGGISSDDPEAIDKLRERLAELETKQATMKMVNRVHKAYKTKPEAKKTADLMASLSDDMGMLVRRYEPAYSWEPHPFAPFQMSNNNGNISRIKKRIAQLQQAEAAPDREPITGEGWKIWEDKDENRLFIAHDAKPPAEVRTMLKRHGFRWSRHAGAWSRLLNNAAWANAVYLAENGHLD